MPQEPNDRCPGCGVLVATGIEDSCVHCDKCGKLLNYTLTDSGADAELDHFRSVRFRRDRLLDRETAFHLARLIAAKSSDPEVISIAARAIRCMRKVPDLTSQ